MRKRFVSGRQVEEALIDPDWTEKSRGETEINTKKYGRREVEVVYKRKKDNYTIITVRVWVK